MSLLEGIETVTEKEEKPVDLTPDLSTVSVSFAEALIRNTALLSEIAGRILAQSFEEEECKNQEGQEVQLQEAQLGSCVDSVRRQLGLQVASSDEIATVAAQLRAAAAWRGQAQQEWFEDILRGYLEAYVQAQATKCSEEAVQAPEGAEFGTLKCRFASGQELDIALSPHTNVGEVKEKLGKAKHLPSSLFRLVSVEGVVVEQCSMLVADAFPDMVTQVVVAPEVFKVGDRVEAAWSGAKDTAGFETPEAFFPGRVTKVSEQGGVAYYSIDWDPIEGRRSASLVHYENSLWRTAHGGVVYAMAKSVEGT